MPVDQNAPPPWDGLPPDPSVDGWYWLRGLEAKNPEPWFWKCDLDGSGDGGWDNADDYDVQDVAKWFVYEGPVTLPGQIDAASFDAGARAERKAALLLLPGGYSYDPQLLADAMRAAPLPPCPATLPPRADDEAFLYTLVDITWEDATGRQGGPSRRKVAELIDRVRAAAIRALPVPGTKE